jgi:preprotein translocase subunit SecE
MKLIIFSVVMALILISSASAEIIISEIMYAPTTELGGQYAEWIEIYNPDNEAVNLTGWKIADPANHSIEGGTLIEPNGYLIITKSAFFSNFSSYYDVSCPIAKSGFTLDNDGETFFIISLNNSLEITYSKSIGANKNNNSLQFVNDEWCEGTPTPGKENKCAEETPPAEEPGNESIPPDNETLNVTIAGNDTEIPDESADTGNESVNITSATKQASAKKNVTTQTISENTSSESKKVIYQSKNEKTRETAIYLLIALLVLVIIYLIKSKNI